MQELYKRVGREFCGWTPVKMLNGTGYTYVNKDNRLMPYRFSYAREFRNDMAVVQTKDGKGWTYISKNEQLMPYRFTSAIPFVGETTYAYINDEKFIVNKKGQCYRYETDFYDSLQEKSDNHGIKFLLKNGKEFELNFDFVTSFCEGMALIQMKDGSGLTYINSQGKIMKNRFKEAGSFYHGIALVVSWNDVKMFVDKSGRLCGYEEMKERIEDYILNNPDVEKMLLEENNIEYDDEEEDEYDDEEKDL